MPRTLVRNVRTRSDADRVFAYLADFTNAREWDSGTVSCDLVSGDGGPGTVYRNVSRFAGREVTLDYHVQTCADRVLVLVGRNATVTSTDTIRVNPDGTGAQVVYLAQFEFTGLARWLGPLIQPLLDRLGNATAAQLRLTLDSLP